MIIYDDDGIGYDVVPRKTIDKIKAEILEIKNDGNQFINIEYLLEIITKHLKEVENADNHNP